MKTKDPATELVRDDDGESLCFRDSMREREADPVMDSLRFPVRARRSLLELRRRTLQMLEALQASTWILLEREIATVSSETAQRLVAICDPEELRSIHDELLRVLDRVASCQDSDMSDPRVCAELLSGSRLLLHLGAELGRAR
jgi:hypothetical protein